MPDSPEVQWFDRPRGEPVVLHPPSPRWGELAAEWAAAIGRVLSALQPRVEHIGSTAVPGLLAKPVVDLQVSVTDLDDETAYRVPLESLGLVLRAREPEHRFFRPPAEQPRSVHVHVCRRGSAWERTHLLFRDRLRARPEVATAYAELKQHLAREVGSDRAACTRARRSSFGGSSDPPTARRRARAVGRAHA
ncbi:GrpB family protein [Blastococcus montanus]|uniref:GrpB family protein n=1 Tax=Blastococcus montanus TaxID=3144973 RepID=UPI0032082B26